MEELGGALLYTVREHESGREGPPAPEKVMCLSEKTLRGHME